MDNSNVTEMVVLARMVFNQENRSAAERPADRKGGTVEALD
jgi:hypothetical protein